MWLPETASLAPVKHHWLNASQVLLAMWLCGALLLLSRWIWTWWKIRIIVREATPSSLSMGVSMLVTSRNIEPGVFGLLRPVLLVPSHILQRLPEMQFCTIVEHERCHIQRRDNLTGAFHMLVETVFWFHPAVWWIERHLIEERERACGEAVLQLGNHAEVYAESILNVCKSCMESPVICMSGVTGSELKQRILRIMTNKPATRLDAGRRLLLGMAALSVVSFPVISGLLPSAKLRAQSRLSRASSSGERWSRS